MMPASVWIVLTLCLLGVGTSGAREDAYDDGTGDIGQSKGADRDKGRKSKSFEALQQIHKDDLDTDATATAAEHLGAGQEEDAAHDPDSTPTTTKDIHGGVKMGEIVRDCDDVKWNLNLDWDNSTDYEYTCQTEQGETALGVGTKDSEIKCLPKDQIPDPIHVCMDTEIVYPDEPPTAGPHRPNWPSFGTYMFVPAQRWVHALEHGAVVFLYHPCADSEQVAFLASIVRSCIRKHVITPYRYLPDGQPLALLTYGCKLLMGRVEQERAVNFIKTTAMRTVESGVTTDGKYTWGQLHKAHLVSDHHDSELCPKPAIYVGELPIAESMDPPYSPARTDGGGGGGGGGENDAAGGGGEDHELLSQD